VEESEIDFPVRRISSLKIRDDLRAERHKKNHTSSWVAGTADGRLPLTPWGCIWLGGILMSLLAAGSLFWGIGHIESELESRALEALVQQDIETAGLDVDFSWRDGKVTGILPATLSARDIEFALSGVRGIRSVELHLTVSEVSTPANIPSPAVGLGPVSVIAQLSGDRVTLNGSVLSEDQRELLLTSAAQAVGVRNINDRLQVSGLVEELQGADDRIRALAAVLANIEIPTSGRIVLVDESLSSSLTVPSDANKILLSETLANSGLIGERQIEVDSSVPDLVLAEEVVALQVELDDLQAEIALNVVFSAGDSALTTEAKETLNKVAAAMNQYQGPVVEAEGHTDSVGVSETNRQLSQAQAELVVAYLISAGVDEARLLPVGYGEDHPIEGNSTRDGRQKNRRVQFSARPEF
jgi:outer membrane protein OmpA-like peptidoglycan-associated protein